MSAKGTAKGVAILSLIISSSIGVTGLYLSLNAITQLLLVQQQSNWQEVPATITAANNSRTFTGLGLSLRQRLYDYEYQVGGQTFQGHSTSANFVDNMYANEGDGITVRYDPSSPEKSTRRIKEAKSLYGLMVLGLCLTWAGRKVHNLLLRPNTF